MPKIVKARLPEDHGYTGNGHSPRLRDLDSAGEYLQISRRSVERLIELGKLPVIKLPVARRAGLAREGTTRRVLVDVRDLDKLIDQSKEYRR
jgi:hypothetical protein